MQCIGRTIRIVGAKADALVEIFNVSGQMVARDVADSFNVAQRGIYIVRVEGKTFKVSVK